MSRKNLFFVFIFLCIQNIRAMEVNVDCWRSVAYQGDISTLCALKETSKGLNEALNDPAILQALVFVADYDWCSKRLDYFSQQNQMDLFTIFFKNNEQTRKQQLIQFFCKKRNENFFKEEIYLQKNVEEICKEVMVYFQWEELLSDLFVIKTIAFSQNPNVHDNKGRTLTTWACGHGYRGIHEKIGDSYRDVLLNDEMALDILLALLKNKNTNWDEKDNYGHREGFTGFTVACYMGKIDFIKILLAPQDLPIDLNVSSGKGTAFAVLCKDKIDPLYNTKEVMRLLLQEPRVQKDYQLLFEHEDKIELLQELVLEGLNIEDIRHVFQDLLKHRKNREEHWKRVESNLNARIDKASLEKEERKKKYKKKIAEKEKYAEELRDIIKRKDAEHNRICAEQQVENRSQYEVIQQQARLAEREQANHLKIQEKIEELELKIVEMRDQHATDCADYQERIDAVKIGFAKEKTAMLYRSLIGFGLFNAILMYLLYSYGFVVTSW